MAWRDERGSQPISLRTPERSLRTSGNGLLQAQNSHSVCRKSFRTEFESAIVPSRLARLHSTSPLSRSTHFLYTNRSHPRCGKCTLSSSGTCSVSGPGTRKLSPPGRRIHPHSDGALGSESIPDTVLASKVSSRTLPDCCFRSSLHAAKTMTRENQTQARRCTFVARVRDRLSEFTGAVRSVEEAPVRSLRPPSVGKQVDCDSPTGQRRDSPRTRSDSAASSRNTPCRHG